MAVDRGTPVQGTATVTAAGSADIIATGAAGTTTFIQKIVVSVFVHQATGVVSITNGTTVYWKILAKDTNGVSWTLDFGEKGYNIGTAKALVLTVATADVSVIATATGYRYS